MIFPAFFLVSHCNISFFLIPEAVDEKIVWRLFLNVLYHFEFLLCREGTKGARRDFFSADVSSQWK